MNFPGTEFLKTTGKLKWTNNCRRVYTFSMKDKTLVNEISRRSRAIGSPLGRVSRTPSLHISDSGSGRRKHKKIYRSRFTLEKILSRLVGTCIHLRAFLHAMMSVMSGKNFNIKMRIYLRSAWHIYILVVSRKWLKLFWAGDDNRQASLSLLPLA